ncbi:MAG: hypothetical protein KDD89_12840, partial [Anaerolineales bacterium]|nr:hypothetical protein [Anaerolineales bacterium]
TPTLIPSPVPSPTAGATPATNPPITAVGSGQLPAISRDLLFISEGGFKRWNHRTGQIDTLVAGPPAAQRTYPDPDDPRRYYGFPGDVTHYDVSDNGTRAIVARIVRSDIVPVALAGQEEPRDLVRLIQELIYVDLVSGETWVVTPAIYNVRALDLSPNGERIAVSATGVGTPPEPIIISEYAADWPWAMFVQEMQGGNGRDTRRVATCDQLCDQPVWHVENNLVVWSDSGDLWLYNISANDPELLLAGEQVDPNIPEMREHFGPIDWANNGRYLRVWRSVIEGGSQAVLDIPTGALIDIPNSFVYIDPLPIEISWMPDDRLLIASNGNSEQPTPTLSLWRVLLEEGRVNQEEALTLSGQSVGVTGSRHLADGRFAYALVGNGTSSDSGTYLLTSLSQSPERVNAVPDSNLGADFPWSAGDMGVYWVSDGSGAIVSLAGETYYAPANGDFLYNVSAALGRGATDFYWQNQ